MYVANFMKIYMSKKTGFHMSTTRNYNNQLRFGLVCHFVLKLHISTLNSTTFNELQLSN